MKKQLLITLVLALGLEAGASSQGLFGIKPESQKRMNANQVQPNTCEDFTGIYEGTCTTNANEKLQLKIQQLGCMQIKFNDDENQIGGIKSESLSTPHQAQSTIKAFQWDQTGKVLQFSEFSHFQVGQQGILPFFMFAKLEKSGSNLNVEGSIWGDTIKCNYSRK